MSLHRILYFTLALIAVLSPSAAQQIQVQAPATVGVGEQFGVSFTVNGQASRIDAPQVTNLTRIGGPSTSSSTSIRMVGNQQQRSQTVTYTYYYRADAEGTATIGEASCTTNGQRITSAPVTIQVSKNAPQTARANQQQRRQSYDPWDDWPDPFAQMQQMQQQMQQMMGGGRPTQPSQPVEIDANSLFARASVNKTAPYVGEQIIVSYKVYTQVSLRQFLIDKLPGNKGFWAEDLTGNRRDVRQWEETVNGRQYRVAEIRRGALYAQEDGHLRIEPLDMDVLAMVPRRRSGSIYDLFDDPFFSMAQSVERHLRTAAVDLHVKPLPEADDHFCGAVGQFTITSDIETPATLRANDAITYRVTIKGSGNLMLITPPQIDFPSAFEVYEPNTDDQIRHSDDGVSGSRTFEWVLIPRSQGDYEIPATEISYFNPQTGRYVTEHLEARTLHVASADPRSTAAANIATAHSNRDIHHIHPLPQRMHHISSYMHAEWWFWMLLVIIIVVTALFPKVYRKRREQLDDVAGLRQKRALKEARRRMRQAERHLHDTDDEAFYQATYKAIWGCLADKYKIALARLSSDTVHDCLTERNVDTERIDEIMQTLHEVDFARFGPGDSSSKKKIIYDRALAMIRHLSFCLLLFISVGQAAAQSADEAYNAGNYADAVTQYEQLVAEGYGSADLYYNLGAAYYRNHQRGAAIVAYERALLLDPADRDIKESLAFVREQNIDRIDPLPSVMLREKAMLFVRLFSARGWRVAILLLAVLSFVGFAVRHTAATTQRRRWATLLLAVTAFLLLVAAVCAWTSQRQITHNSHVVVTSSEAPLYAAPDPGSTLLQVLHEGTSAQIKGSADGWWRVVLDDGTDGWLQPVNGERIQLPLP